MLRLTCILIILAACPNFSFLHAEKIVLVMGGGADPNSTTLTGAKLNGPFGIDFDRRGNVFVVEMPGNRVRQLGHERLLTIIDTNRVRRPTVPFPIIAGTGEKGAAGDGGPAAAAQLNGPHSLAVSRSGDIYVADTWNNRVRKIDLKKQSITTVIGTGNKAFSGDGGPAIKADFGGIYCVAFDGDFENLFLADLDNRRIRKVNLKSGIVQTVAGNGQKGVPAEGALATDAPLVDPRAVAVDRAGLVYILERSGNALRSVDASGRIHTLIGPGETASGAESVKMNGPKHLCIDREQNVIIADTENHLIRKYMPGERKTVVVAGTGKKGTKGVGGPPLEAELNQPHGVTVDSSGTLYIADSSNDRVLKIEN